MSFANLKAFKDAIKAKTASSIFNRIDTNSENYYCITKIKAKKNIDTSKWRTYLYLRECILAYRNGNTTELNDIIHFLENNIKAKQWLAARLLDSVTKSQIEKWGSGQHEWLERSLIIDVLKRSAGIINPGEEEITLRTTRLDKDGNSFTYNCTIDWLFVQATLRSPTKYIFFRNNNNTLEHGHPGAIKNSQKTFETKGSHTFHNLLEDYFSESTSLGGFLQRIRNTFKRELYSGKKEINASPNNKQVITGAKTNNKTEVNVFMKSVKKDGYTMFNQKSKEMKQIVTKNGTLANSASDSVASEVSPIAP